MPSVRWKHDVGDGELDAALRYLTLRYDSHQAQVMVRGLRNSKLRTQRAADILHAARLAPAPLDDAAVRSVIAALACGSKLAPILLVNFEDHVDVAEGFPRLSLVYHVDADAGVPCRIAYGYSERPWP